MDTKTSTDTASARTDLPIEGMTCASCANTIERRLGKQPGVTSANVNFATKVATVKYDPAATGPEQLAKAVDDIGYKAIVPAPAPAKNGATNPAHGHMGGRVTTMRRCLRPKVPDHTPGTRWVAAKTTRPT